MTRFIAHSPFGSSTVITLLLIPVAFFLALLTWPLMAMALPTLLVQMHLGIFFAIALVVVPILVAGAISVFIGRRVARRQEVQPVTGERISGAVAAALILATPPLLLLGARSIF